MKNKNALATLLVCVLLLLAAGISFAIFNYSGNSSANTINTGKISFVYTEPSNSYVLEDALPILDSDGILQNNYFEFTVSSSVSAPGNITIPYQVSLTPKPVDTGFKALPNSAIRVYLTEVNDNIETAVVSPTGLISLDIPAKRTDSFVIYESTMNHSTATQISKTYRLRAWLTNSLDTSLFEGDDQYQYKFVINIDAESQE